MKKPALLLSLHLVLQFLLLFNSLFSFVPIIPVQQAYAVNDDLKQVECVLEVAELNTDGNPVGPATTFRVDADEEVDTNFHLPKKNMSFRVKVQNQDGTPYSNYTYCGGSGEDRLYAQFIGRQSGVENDVELSGENYIGRETSAQDSPCTFTEFTVGLDQDYTDTAGSWDDPLGGDIDDVFVKVATKDETWGSDDADPDGTVCKFKFDRPSSIGCEWAPLNNSQSAYNNYPAFCYGGFNSVDEMNNHNLVFECIDNCGGAGKQAWKDIFGGNEQKIRIGDIPSEGNALTDWAMDSSDQVWSCAVGTGFDKTVTDTVNNCINPSIEERLLGGSAGCALSVLGGVTFTAATAGFGLVGGISLAVAGCTASGGAAGFAGTFNQVVSDCQPKIEARIENEDGERLCRDEFTLNFDLDEPLEEQTPEDAAGNYGSDEADDAPFAICRQIPEHNEAARAECCKCATGGATTRCIDAEIQGNIEYQGIWTSIGCIDRDPTSIIQTILKVGLSIAGGITILMVLAAGFMLSTSQGDPKRTSEARELVTSAVVGILFIIFSVTILQFIGVTILQIPGFGSN